MKRKIICILMMMVLFLWSFPMNVNAASTVPVITNPTQYSSTNSYEALKVEWEAPTGTVSNYVISVRWLFDGEKAKDTLIVEKVALSSATRSYTIPWSKLALSSTYRISVSAVMADGTQRWSVETYFFTTFYKVVANKTVSFYLYSGFPTSWKDAIYYSAQTWNSVLALGYEVVNTYPYSQCHNSTEFVKGDGKNRITNALPGIDDVYVMRTSRVLNASGGAAEVDININDTMYNFTVGAQSGYHDIHAAMTHEMGHAIGLTHCNQAFASTWTMYTSTPTNDISKRSLESGDRLMFSSIYLNI